MIIDRIFTPGLAQVTYLAADETTRQPAVIDPRRDVEASTMQLVAILRRRVSPHIWNPVALIFRWRCSS
jgi:hypothetical protein